MNACREDLALPTLFSTQRNEGPFLLEWLAFNHTIGFDRAVIFSNGCTDGSDRLLDVIASEIGFVEHHIQEVGPDEAPQKKGPRRALDQGLFAEGEWVMWMDADEYLNVHIGERKVTDLVARAEQAGAQGLTVHWRIFGSAGLTEWPGRQLDPGFTRAGARIARSSRMVKTLFCMSEHVHNLDPHRPYLDTDFLEAGKFYLDGSGKRIPDRFYLRKRGSGAPDFMTPGFPSYKLAQINHYAVRTRDAFNLRQSRGRGFSPSTGKARYSDKHFRRYDRNTFSDRSILPLVPAVDQTLATWLSNPAIREAHLAASTALPQTLA